MPGAGTGFTVWFCSQLSTLNSHLRRCLRTPAPMPGFVADAVRIISWIRKMKSKFAGVALEPAEGARAAEFFVEADVVGRAHVERAARVVLAIAGRGDEAENLGDGLAGGEFAADVLGLPPHA